MVKKAKGNSPHASAVDTETPVQSLGREDPWRRAWQPTAVFLPGESHGQRSLVGYSPQDHKELDTVEHAHTHTKLSLCHKMHINIVIFLG